VTKLQGNLQVCFCTIFDYFRCTAQVTWYLRFS